jgi:hypothetical protein
MATQCRSAIPAVFVAGALLIACRSEPAPVAELESTWSGDTLVVSSPEPRDTILLEAYQVLLQSDELDVPRAMAVIDGRSLAIADRTVVHVLDLETLDFRTLGREGAGPGEFRAVAAVGWALGDSIAAFDPTLRRITVWHLPGTAVRQQTAVPALPYVNTVPGNALVVTYQGGFLMYERTNVNADGSRFTALVHYPLDAAPVPLRTWPAPSYFDTRPGFMGPPNPYDVADPPIAVSFNGLLAHGSGKTNCVVVEDLRDADGTPRKFCRRAARVKPGPAILNPDVSVIADVRDRDGLSKDLRYTELPGEIPAYDQLRWDNCDRLWVRVLGPEMSSIHPWLLTRRPDLGPRFRNWDVFDGEGRVLHTVSIPAGFFVRAIHDDRIFGTVETPVGELVVAGLVLPAERQSGRDACAG